MCDWPPPMSIRVAHPRVQEHRPDVRREHVHVVEVGVRAVLEHPRPAARVADVRHRHGLAGPVDDLGAVERQRAHGLRVLAVAAADRARGCRCRRCAAPDRTRRCRRRTARPTGRRRRAACTSARGTTGGSSPPGGRPRPWGEMTNSVLKYRSGITSGQRALHWTIDVGVVLLRQGRELLGLLARDVDEQLARGRHVRDVEVSSVKPVSAPSASAIDLDRHVDADDADRGVDAVLDRGQVAADVLPLADAVDHGREADRQVRRRSAWTASWRACSASARCVSALRAVRQSLLCQPPSGSSTVPPFHENPTLR